MKSSKLSYGYINKAIYYNFVPRVIHRLINKIGFYHFVRVKIRRAEKRDLNYPSKELFVTTVMSDEKKVYFEYGVGVSTVFVRKNTNHIVYAVDNNKYWLEIVNSSIKFQYNDNLVYVDTGKTLEYSRPVSYEKFENFTKYVESVFNQRFMPDIVNIDGRFSLACIIYIRLNTKKSVKVLFANYVDYPSFVQIIEKFNKPISYDSYYALFELKPLENKDSEEYNYYSEIYFWAIRLLHNN